ncbi:type II toxin-antitoxin system RelE/ParE family toxin [Endozoicomonas sp. Mp262]|uniref:type II toxin-antitoxin system RelE/ParE family toxin n=1 Tax=Endozoicomonas sp. Mp262 TaxID=2919499 RepID=UPI0021D97D9D
MTLKVVEYIQPDGKSPYATWFNALPAQAAAKVATAQIRLERGLTSSIKWFAGLGEYRINWGKGLRIYLAKDGDELIVLLGGGDKSSQKQDIIKAKALLSEYKQRKTQKQV